MVEIMDWSSVGAIDAIQAIPYSCTCGCVCSCLCSPGNHESEKPNTTTSHCTDLHDGLKG